MLELLTRRLTVQPSTMNAEERSVEVVLSAFADVRRSYGIERLSPDPSHWEIPEYVPLIDGHRNGSFRDVLGQVRNIRFEGGRMIGTAFVSNDEAWGAIERGDVRNVSIGYAPQSFTDTREGGVMVRTLTKTTLREVSLVPIGADPSATVRNANMEPEVVTEEAEVTSAPEVTTRAEIRTICRSAGMTVEQADELIDRDPTVIEARAAAREHQSSRRPIINVGRSSEDPAVTRGLQAEALAASFTGAEPSERARQYVGMSLLGHASLCLTRSGERGVATMGTDKLVTRAMATTSDFPLLMNDAGNRTLLAAYGNAESPLKRLARQGNLPNFREGKFLRAGGIPNLREVTEAGEIKHVTTLEAGEGYKLKTYASIMSVSRQLIINDDFSVFGQWATNAGIAAANTEAELLSSLLLDGAGAGPLMSDGKRLFHVDHGNLAAAGAAPDVDELSAARLAMRRQTGLDGVSLINATPKFLLVSADLETTGEQLLATLAANTVADANPFSGKLTLLVEPRLPDGTWYVFADPASVPVLAYGYLSSAPGPQLASRDGWDVLGREFRVHLDFGAGAIDWRGAYHNPGEEI